WRRQIFRPIRIPLLNLSVRRTRLSRIHFILLQFRSMPENNDNNSKPIGVFDSGIGGLTVVSALRSLLPNESIFYLGDTARVPYGGKSAATVQRYSLEIAAMLLGER